MMSSHRGSATGTSTGMSTATDTPIRPGTPDSEITSIPHGRPANPFASPYTSMPPSRAGSTMNLQPPQRYFHSRRVKPGTVEQPWKDNKDPMAKWVTVIPILGILIGLGLSGLLIWEGLTTVVNHQYCLKLDDDFSKGFDANVWTKQAEVGGFGNGQFEQTTTTDENVFIDDGMLVIKPTLQDQTLIDTDGTIVDLLADGTCSNPSNWQACITGTNKTNGTIVNPVRSGRIHTLNGPRIKYGRIEVVAKLPAGDWLWPAIWLLPAENTYGDWPRSGEIDIVESRGNNYTYPQGGNNIISSAIHWGPNEANDGWWRNNVKRAALHTTYSTGFHTFGLEWSEKYLFTYVDTRLLQVTYVDFKKPFWQVGQFPLSDSNGTRLTDPWGYTGRTSTPFDQDFYLLLNVGVGGTNGWFKDSKNGKPWVDGSPSAKLDFWNARNQWYPTWKNTGKMVVKSVKIWQQKGYNGC